MPSRRSHDALDVVFDEPVRYAVSAAAIGAALVWMWIIGVVVAVSVIRIRAGAGFWRGLKVFGHGGFGPVWVGTALVCAMVWPVTLAVWLARGRPEPRVVFNEKALERQRRQARSV
jgi:hypothetical protein